MRSATASATPVFGGPFGQHDELIAAETPDGVTLAQHLGQSGSHAGQELIARPMPQGVVDVLEVVEVQEERGGRGVLASGMRHHVRDPVEDQRPIGQTGEWVVERLMAELVGAFGHELQGPGSARSQQVEHESQEQAQVMPPTSRSSA